MRLSQSRKGPRVVLPAGSIPPGTESNQKKTGLRRFFAILGPGLVTGAADDDPSGIVTYSIAGAQLGTRMLWVALLSWPLMCAVQMMCARIGMVTGGGLASALNEIAEAARVKIAVEQKLIPVREDVHAACEMLGLDPLHVANEGRFVAFIAAAEAARAVQIMRRHEVAMGSAVIGTDREKSAPLVTIKSSIGARRILDMPSGEQLPRIC